MEKAPAVLDEKPDESLAESRPNKNGKRLFQDEQVEAFEVTAKRPAKSPADVATTKNNVEEMKAILQKLKIQAAEMDKADEVLRKLKLVKIYRAQKKMDKIGALIETWRQACQEAVQALAKSSNCEQKSTTCKDILDQLKMEYSVIKYNPEDDCFY